MTDPVALRPIGSTGKREVVTAMVVPSMPHEGEVRFRLTLHNAAGAPATLANPYTGLSYHLISASGTPVQVPAPPSAAKVHVRRDPAERHGYLRVVRATIDGAEVDAAEVESAADFPVQRDGEIDIEFAVREAIDATSRERLPSVPPGDYGLVVILRMVSTVDGKRSPLSFRTERNAPVTVR